MSPPLRPKSGTIYLKEPINKIEISKEPVNYADKCQLCNAVNGLQERYMSGVIKIFQEENPKLLRVCNYLCSSNTFSLAAPQ